ncbi:MAG: hypothetical protein H6612_07915 [Ignavibacteriales bacterium]|nr:hypothetical protein [Ignavibacteriales bacterium]MCB9259267.1 hypothetical protein [Ignavibacteriales bacterium]
MTQIKYFIFTSIFIFSLNIAQENTDEKPFKIFFESYGSLFQYVQSEINFVDIVRNPDLAEIYILMDGARTGSGGSEYTFTFIGQNGFKGINDTLKHSFLQNTTLEQRNKELVNLIKSGLVRYIARTPYNKYLKINFEKEFKEEKIVDKWDGWVFGLGVVGSVEAEKSKKEYQWELDFDIDRVSEASKFMVDANSSNDFEKYTSDEGESSISKRRRIFRTLYVISISDHFSAGLFTGFTNSTYNNLKQAYDFSPAFEYNYFPYQESIRRNFTFLYRIGYVYNDYYNETIYFKNSENLFRHSLSIGYRLNETWGDAHFYLTTGNYLHDFSKAKVDLWSRIGYRLTGSLSFNIQAEVSYINDQLYLEQEGATLEEILFNQKSLATDYEYQLSLGFRYTIGSIYNNIVNTRF